MVISLHHKKSFVARLSSRKCLSAGTAGHPLIEVAGLFPSADCAYGYDLTLVKMENNED